jgi:hypothetical protein
MYDPSIAYLLEEKLKAQHLITEEKFKLFYERMDNMELKYVSIAEAPQYIVETMVPINTRFE